MKAIDTMAANKEFGALITRLIQKNNLTRQEAKQAFITLLNNETSQMQQGAFLAALTAKGETAMEVAGSWEAIYDLDTTKVSMTPDLALVENSGTGMDTFKTYNISTAASIIAAAGNIPMAHHGARAITSLCGTVDMAEALGRILSQIFFGSTLNIAASLANPANGFEILEKIGGFEIAGIAGAILGAASKGCAVVLDGVISTAAGLVAHTIDPLVQGYLISGHKSVLMRA